MEAPASQLIALRTPDKRPYFLSVTPSQDVYHEAAAQGGMFDHVPRLLWGLVAPGDVFFDIGANIGTVSIPLAIKGAEVHAFEMLSENVAHLTAASQASAAPVNVHEVAVWRNERELSVGGGSAWAQIVGSSDRKVRAVSIDRFIHRHGIHRLDAVKIDIEGSELPALQGMSRTLKKHHPDIVIEANIYCNNGTYSFQELFFLLTKFGYKFFRIQQNTLSPFHLNGLQEIVFCDYLATKKEDREIVEKTGFEIRPMTPEEIVEGMLREDLYPDVHKIYGALALKFMASDDTWRPICNDSRLQALAEKWRSLSAESEKLTADLRTGSRSISDRRLRIERWRRYLFGDR